MQPVQQSPAELVTESQKSSSGHWGSLYDWWKKSKCYWGWSTNDRHQLWDEKNCSHKLDWLMVSMVQRKSWDTKRGASMVGFYTQAKKPREPLTHSLSLNDVPHAAEYCICLERSTCAPGILSLVALSDQPGKAAHIFGRKTNQTCCLCLLKWAKPDWFTGSNGQIYSSAALDHDLSGPALRFRG